MNFLYNKHLCSRMVYTIVLLVLFAWEKLHDSIHRIHHWLVYKDDSCLVVCYTGH